MDSRKGAPISDVTSTGDSVLFSGF